MILSAMGCLVFAAYLSIAIGAGMFSESPGYFTWIILFVVYCAFFLAPFALSLPILLPIAFKNRNTNRIVVFRKFNSPVSKKGISRIVRPVVSNYGHVFTLSDSNYKTKWYVRIPVLLGQMSFFHFRHRNISKKKHLDGLGRTLNNKGWLNVNWLLSSSKVFAIKTTDDLWQDTARMLLNGCNLLVIDVSEFTKSLEWESKMAQELDFEQRILLIAHEKSRDLVSHWKKSYDRPDEYDIPVYFYNEKGHFTSTPALEDSICDIISKDRNCTQALQSRNMISKVLINTAAIGLLFGIIFFFLSPYLVPDFVGKHSPFARQAINGYLQSRLRDRVLNKTQLEIQARIRKRWPQQAAKLTVTKAYNHDRAECDAFADALEELADSTQPEKYIGLIEKGDREMAAAACRVLRKSELPDLQQTALRLIADDRIDAKEFGLELIGRKPASREYKAKLAGLIASNGFNFKNAPPNHYVEDGLAEGIRKAFGLALREDPFGKHVANWLIKVHDKLDNEFQIDLDKLRTKISPDALSELLFALMHERAAPNQAALMNVLSSSASAIKNIAVNEKGELEARVHASWLLAKTGDLSVAAMAIEAYKYTYFWSHPYKRLGMEILTELNRTASQKLDKHTADLLKVDMPAEITALLDQLQQ